jgi:aminocarboxymuconate-semialdehyde decarboxylase
MTTIDLHSHVIPPTIVEAIRRDPQRFGARIEEKDGRLHYTSHGWSSALDPAFYDVEAKLEWMDRARLDISALSVAPPAYYYWLPAEAGLAAARLANDGIAQMAAKKPDRLRGLATLPMQDTDAAVAELERVKRELGFPGVEIATSIDGVPLADPKFRKVLKTVEQLGLFVFAHPYKCIAQGGMEPWYLGNTIGFLLDTTICMAHLMYGGALDELKALKILVPHAGGFVPYQIGRFEHAHRVRPEAQTATKSSPAELLKRFYFDAMAFDGIGTDHPFDTGPTQPVTDLEAIPGLTAAEREWITSKTARSLLG